MTKNKHGWVIVEPRTLRANATAIKAAGIDWKTSRGMQMVGEWTALAEGWWVGVKGGEN